jgi:hypothetical protein
MTEEDKKRISECMGWKFSEWRMIDGSTHVVNPHFFDLNDAGLCVVEMQKRGDWQDFVQITSKIHKLGFHSEVIAWLFNAENFFEAMSQWLKEGKK